MFRRAPQRPGSFANGVLTLMRGRRKVSPRKDVAGNAALLLRLEATGADDLAPLFGFVGDQSAESGR